MRSHYDRHDLEILFQLQPRAAQKLLEILPSVLVGTSKLAEREALVAFLDRVRDAEDGTGLLEKMKKERSKVGKRSLRSLVRRDLAEVDLASLPRSIEIVRGRLTVSFRSVEQLAENMLMLARILESDGEEFARAFEPQPPQRDTPDQKEQLEIAALLNSAQ